jgi:O-antigen ligase
VSGKYKIYLNNYDYLFLLLIGYGTLTIPFSQDLINGLRMSLGSIIIFSMYLTAKKILIENDFDYKAISGIIKVSGYLFIVPSLLYYLLGVINVGGNFNAFNGLTVYGVTIDRGIPRLNGIISDPNVFVFYSTLFFFFLFFKQNKLSSDYTLLCLVSVAMMLTLSRGGFLAIVLPIIIYYFNNIFASLFKIRLQVTSILKLFIFVICMFFLLSYFLQNSPLVSGFLETRLETASQGSGRFEIWENGLSLFIDNPFFGVGWYNFLYYNVNSFDRFNYAHNTFLEVLVELGMVGFAIYLLFWALILTRTLQLAAIGKRYKFLVFTLISFFISFNSLSLIINEVFFLFLALTSVLYIMEKRALWSFQMKQGLI